MKYFCITLLILSAISATCDAQLYRYGTTINTTWGSRQCPNPYCVMCWNNYGPIPGYQKVAVRNCIRGRCYTSYKIVKSKTNTVNLPIIAKPVLPVAPKEVVLNFGPTPDDAIDLIPTIVNLDSNIVFYDFGSADGRILKRFASKVKKAIGIERDKTLVNASRNLLNGISNAFVIEADFINQEIDFDDADIIYVHQNTGLLKKLVPILKRKVKTGTIILSYNHDIPDVCTEKIQLGTHIFYLHKVNKFQDIFDQYRIK